MPSAPNNELFFGIAKASQSNISQNFEIETAVRAFRKIGKIWLGQHSKNLMVINVSHKVRCSIWCFQTFDPIVECFAFGWVLWMIEESLCVAGRLVDLNDRKIAYCSGAPRSSKCVFEAAPFDRIRFMITCSCSIIRTAEPESIAAFPMKIIQQLNFVWCSVVTTIDSWNASLIFLSFLYRVHYAAVHINNSSEPTISRP